MRLSPAIRGINKVIKASFKPFGFEWNTFQHEDIVIGYWRKRFTTKTAKPASKSKRLVVVPGFGDAPSTWLPTFAPMFPKLKTRYDEIILLDFPGFPGLLMDEKPIYSMDLMRSAVFRLLSDFKPHSVFGHSLGGWLTAAYSLSVHHDEAPEKIVLANTSGVIQNKEDGERWGQFFKKAIEMGASPVAPKSMIGDSVVCYLVGKAFEEFYNRKEISSFVNSVREDHFVNHELYRMPSKVWLVWGDSDTITPTKWIHDWIRILNDDNQNGFNRPRARGLIIKNSGHTPHIETPRILANVLKDIFLENDSELERKSQKQNASIEVLRAG